ncbi:two-component system, chemotaxis family, sensor kinase CheA [Gammaproteobacteria bacterium]
MNMNDALVTFVTECRDLLQVMEQELLHCEQTGADQDTIDTLFRAAHTIKGSAGMFGLDRLVAFTHEAEGLLQQVRDGLLSLEGERVDVLLASVDYITTLVDLVELDGGAPSPEVEERGKALRARLAVAGGSATTSVISSHTAITTAVPPATRENVAVVKESGSHPDANDFWHISVRFDRDLLRNGMDPLGLLRYLQRLGRIVSIATVTTDLPRAKEMKPEDCYLGFEIGLVSDKTKADLEAVFNFVRENCRLRIQPPRTRLTEYLSYLEDLDETERLGEILIRCGALTSWGLSEALRLQTQMAAEATPETLMDGKTSEETVRKPLGQVVVEEGMVHPEVVEAALATQRRNRERKAADAASLRVNAAKLDALIEVIGELVIASAGAELLARQVKSAELQEASAAVARLVEGARNGALQLRMVQIGEVFSRFQRVVRDVSKELGKDIELVIHGAETELDKTVVEQIADPLTHLVRNAIDHGIEAAELRTARGKPAHGCLTLDAYHDAGSIIIVVDDDGGGLDFTRIRKRAEERGLLAQGQVVSDAELCKFIFEPGFSTNDIVTNLSGRGVGMDVVRRNIEALRGEVNIETHPGEGSTIYLHLPLTLAIIDGFLVGVGEAQYVVPLDMVAECREFSEGDRELARTQNCLNLRGAALPCVHLCDYFGQREPPARRQNVVVVRAGNRKIGLVVDRLMGQFQTVIKPLSPIFGAVPGVSGSTILGSGKVALILDVPSLIQHAVEQEASHLLRRRESIRVAEAGVSRSPAHLASV